MKKNIYSAEQFHKSLEMVSQQKGDIWVLGDLNYPKLDWDAEDIPFIRPGCTQIKLNEGFIENLKEFSLMQMVREPTRGGNILDLFLTHSLAVRFRTFRLVVYPSGTGRLAYKCL